MKIQEIFNNLLYESIQERGCLMVFFDNTQWKFHIRDLVDENDIYEDSTDKKNSYGYEDDAHVTVLFGFNDKEENIDRIPKYCVPIDNLDDIYSDKIDFFENEEYDVLKYNILSDKLAKMNKTFTDNFEYENSYSEYHPHITIAYLKKGMGKKYKKVFKNKVKFNPMYYVYSDANRKNYKFR